MCRRLGYLLARHLGYLGSRSRSQAGKRPALAAITSCKAQTAVVAHLVRDGRSKRLLDHRGRGRGRRLGWLGRPIEYDWDHWDHLFVVQVIVAVAHDLSSSTVRRSMRARTSSHFEVGASACELEPIVQVRRHVDRQPLHGGHLTRWRRGRGVVAMRRLSRQPSLNRADGMLRPVAQSTLLQVGEVRGSRRVRVPGG
jgi:hypothetical protein